MNLGMQVRESATTGCGISRHSDASYSNVAAVPAVQRM